MAGEKQEAPWPIPAFNFMATFGKMGSISFQEVSGLDTERDTIEYRAGNSKDFSTVKMPELNKHSDITLKKVVFTDNLALFDFFASAKMNAAVIEPVTIQLLDEAQNLLFTWTLKNAMVKKVSGVTLNAKNSEAALEMLVLTCEGLTISK